MNHCFGCGPQNKDGLRIKSYWDGERESICEFMPKPYHMAGPTHVVYGGLIASLIDCHCICTAVADGYRREGREPDEGELIWYVTGNINVTYSKPTPIDEPISLRAKIEEQGEKKTIVSCIVSTRGVETARGVVIAIRVPPQWLNPA